jgi:hypothetical protein
MSKRIEKKYKILSYNKMSSSDIDVVDCLTIDDNSREYLAPSISRGNLSFQDAANRLLR